MTLEGILYERALSAVVSALFADETIGQATGRQ